MRVEETVDVRRAVDDVWEFVADLSNDPLWCPKVKAVQRVGVDRWQVTRQLRELKRALEIDAHPPADG